METWMVEVVGGVAKCQICRKVVVRGVYCTCDPMIGWHKHCMGKQVKANVETVCKKCKTTVHLEQGRVGGSQQVNRKRKNGDEEMDVGAQDEDKEVEKGGNEEEEERAAAEGDEDEETGEGPSKEVEKPVRRGRRRINVENDSD